MHRMGVIKMKLLIDTEWFDYIKDLTPDKKDAIFESILNYPEVNPLCNNISYWNKKIQPTLEKGRIGYFNKIKTLKQNKKIEDVKNTTDTEPIRSCNGLDTEPIRDDIEKKLDKDVKEIVNKLKYILVNHYNRDFNSSSWGTHIRKMIKNDKLSFDDMMEKLDWYEKNIGGTYTPVIQSASSFREKYCKLENAVMRENNANNYDYTNDDEKCWF
jgi:hypothetical protein